MNESDEKIYAKLKLVMHSTIGQQRAHFEKGLFRKGSIS